MRYTPPINKKQSFAFLIFFTASTLTLIGFSISSSGFGADLLKASAFIIFMVEILFAGRYTTGTYTYILEDFEFLIVRTSFGKSQAVCRLYYTDIIDVKPKKEAKKALKGIVKHNYCPSFYSKETEYIFFESGDKTEVLVIEPVPYFSKALEKRIKNDIIL